jgi:hypothetical protein
MKNLKYYLTMDVGIKNLAYCLVRYDNTKTINNGLDILKWDILDVSFKPLICKHIINKRKICNTNSIYYLLKENIEDIPKNHLNMENIEGYCQHHANKLKEQDKITHKKLFRVSKNKIFVNNFNVQIERLLQSLKIFFEQEIKSVYHIENMKTFNVENLNIYIENQPVFKNPIMKSISIGIFTYFMEKKLEYPTLIESVNFISASDKTHLTFINSMKETLNITTKTDINYKIYTERKNFAIDITNQIISNLQKNIFNILTAINYEKIKKKDDLADALIYVIVLLLKNK